MKRSLHVSRRELLWFSIAGSLGLLVNMALVWLMAPVLGPWWAEAIAFPLATSVTWLVNRQFTFGASGRALWHEWTLYVGGRGLGAVANYATYGLVLLLWPLAHRYPELAVLAATAVGAGFNFYGSRLALS